MWTWYQLKFTIYCNFYSHGPIRHKWHILSVWKLKVHPVHKQLINKFKVVQQSSKQVLKCYCPNVYTVSYLYFKSYLDMGVLFIWLLQWVYCLKVHKYFSFECKNLPAILPPRIHATYIHISMTLVIFKHFSLFLPISVKV